MVTSNCQAVGGRFQWGRPAARRALGRLLGARWGAQRASRQGAAAAIAGVKGRLGVRLPHGAAAAQAPARLIRPGLCSVERRKIAGWVGRLAQARGDRR
jgi:hypothetical protein